MSKWQKFWLFVIAVVFVYIVLTSPEQAANIIHDVWHLVQHAVYQTGKFLGAVIS